jgi:transketolase
LCVIVRACECESLDWDILQHQLIAFGWQVDVCDSPSGFDEAYHYTISSESGPVLMMCRFDSVLDLENNSLVDETSGNYRIPFEQIGDQLDIELSCLGIAGLRYDFIECKDRISDASNFENMKDTIGEALLQFAGEHEEIMLLDAASMSSRYSKRFRSLYPSRYLRNVQPADAASAVLGMAHEGLLPVIRTTAASTMDDSIMQSEARVIYVSHDAGLPDESSGSKAANLNDIALCGSHLNCVMIQPSCAAEAYHALQFAIEESRESVMLRISGGTVQPSFSLPDGYYFRMGRGAIVREGRDALLFAYGPVMVQRGLQVAEMLERHDFHLTVVNMPWLNRVDLRWLRPLLSPYDQVFVLEDHASVGGLGDFLMRECAQSHFLPRRQFRIFGADGACTKLTGPELFRHHELDEEYLAAEILKSAGNLRLSYSALQAARDIRKILEPREQGEAVRSLLDIDHELLKSL